MIKSINIENFQSHKSTELEFHSGMNVIIGKSDSGKTAIIRALKWLITNRPGGDAFRSSWGGDTCVNIEVDNNIVSRNKTNKVNSYGFNEMEFLAFGQEVPAEIISALNMNEINLQQQMDNVFLLSETSGNIAAHFNKVAKLDKIDKATSFVNSAISKITQDIKYTEKEIKAKEIKLAEFVDLESFENDLRIIEKLDSGSESLILKNQKITFLILSINRIETEIEKKSKILLMEIDLNVVLEFIESRKIKLEKYQTIKKLSLNIYHTQQNIKEIEKELAAERDIDKLLKLHENSKIIHQDLKILQKLYSTIVNNKTSQETTLKSINEMDTKFWNNMGAVCALCGTEL